MWLGEGSDSNQLNIFELIENVSVIETSTLLQPSHKFRIIEHPERIVIIKEVCLMYLNFHFILKDNAHPIG